MSSVIKGFTGYSKTILPLDVIKGPFHIYNLIVDSDDTLAKVSFLRGTINPTTSIQKFRNI